jgi:hypothetical protein
MRRPLVFGLMTTGALLALGPAGADTLAERDARSPVFTVSKARPQAGKSFAAFVLFYGNAASLRSIDLDCQGAIAGRPVRGAPHPFFLAGDQARPAAFVCSYRIPRRTAGRAFVARVNTTIVDSSGGIQHGDGVPHRWRIDP